jgi:signal transduction histidine kinase/CheY-like chemotaxis protein
LPPEQVAAFLEEMSTSHARTESRGRWKHYRKNQTLIEVEVTVRDFTYAGAPARLAVVDDISEQLRREDEAYQGSKMELAGRIAGGVARQFADVLASIENHIDQLRRKSHDAANGEQLQEITLGLTRGTNLIYQLLAAGGQQPMQTRPLDLNRLIANLTLILRRIGGEKVNIQNLCGPNPLPVIADPQVLEHMIINLVKNARDATPEKGSATIRTAVVRVDPAPVPRIPEAGGAEFVRLSIRDTGCGMPPEVQTHLFEPFFTTKNPEDGIGLGLAGIYGAVRQLGGWVECLSTPGSGTEFRIYLPCVSESLLPTASEMHTIAASERGTVLLVDPNDRSRAVARYILNRHGYRVVEADCGSIAQTLWERQAREIDLIVVDMTLPGASGFDLANQLRQSRPDLKVIYAYAGDESQIPILPDGSTAVTKPYHSEKLIATVEACLPETDNDQPVR